MNVVVRRTDEIGVDKNITNKPVQFKFEKRTGKNYSYSFLL